jgi:quercetin dioxygenase-like cupin family protein
VREEPPSHWVVAAPGAQMRRMVEGDGASIVLYRIEPGTKFESHVHPFAELGVVLAGEGRFELTQESRVLREGDSFYIPAETAHGFSVPEGATTVVMINVTVPVPSDIPEDPAGSIIRLAENVVKRTGSSSESP